MVEPEVGRLAELQSLGVLDTAPDRAFDAIVQAAAAICGVPISLISLVDRDRQWFKANHGLNGVSQTSRDVAFCAHAIQSSEPMVVRDAVADPRFATNPLVTGNPDIRFYAGIPLSTDGLSRLGTLCVIDRESRDLSADQLDALEGLARVVEVLLKQWRSMAAETRASQALRHTFDAVIDLDSAGRVSGWNAAAEILFGWTEADMLGCSLDRLMPAGASWSLPAGADQTTRRDQILLTRDGRELEVIITTVVQQSVSGQPLGFTKFIRDVTAERQAAAALARSEARFRTLSSGAPIGIYATDVSGACTFTNPRWQDIYGLSADQALGSGWSDALHPDDRDRVFAAWAAYAAAGTLFDEEFRIRHLGGAERVVRSKAQPYRTPEGALQGHVGSVEDITDARLLQDRLMASEARLRQLYERTPAMLHSIDAEGRLLSVSDAWLAKLGYRRDDVIGQASLAFLTESSAVRAREEVLPAFFLSGHCHRVPYQMRCLDGRILEVELSAILERDESGRPVRSMAILEDVTEQMADKRALEAERQRLANILDGMAAGTWEWNVQTGEVRFNERWADIVGWSLAELAPLSIRTWESLAHPEDLARSAEALERHFRGESAFYSLEARMRHRQGHWVWVLDRGRVLTRLPSGEPEWMFGIHVDITGLKQQEAALRRSEAFLSRAGQVAGVGAWELDVNQSLLTWSAQTRRIHAVDDGYVPTVDSAINFYAPAARDLISKAVTRAMELGEGFDLELPLIRADGVSVWVRAVGAAEQESGRTVRLIGAFQDVTERKRIEQSLDEARRRAEAASMAKGDFLANVSHEIRTPLNAVQGFAYLLSATALNEDQRHMVDRLQSAAATVLDTINGVLDLSKIEAGGLSLESGPIDLRACVAGVVEIEDVRSRQKGIELRVQVDPTVPQVLGDALRVRQVLLNLVSNAIKFTHVGHVSVTLAWQRDRAGGQGIAILSVADTGIGMSEETVRRLFEPFFQADSSSARLFGGTGLGLSIVHRLVALMGGQVVVDSAVGQGSRFEVRVPFVEAQPKAGHAPVPKPVNADKSGSLAGCTLLLADDSDINREVVRRILEKHGARIVEVQDGLQAVAAAEAGVHLVLMDLQMPGVDGLEATRQIRSRMGARSPRVLALTAGATDEKRAQAIEAGMVGFVTKPFIPQALVDAIASALDRPSSVHVAGQVESAQQRWPDIDGIDRAAVYERLAGNADLFQRMLARMVAEFATLEPEGQLSDSAVRRRFAERVHRLRGISGTLSITRLHGMASALEDALREGRLPAAATLLNAVQRELHALMSALPSALDAPPDQASARPMPLNRDAIGARLERLKSTLIARDLRALDAWQELQPLLPGVFPSADVVELSRNIDSLRFDEACRMVERWQGGDALACCEDDHGGDADVAR